MQKYLLITTLLFNCFFSNLNAQKLELVKEISTGYGSSNPYNFTAAANKLFFVAKGDDNQFKLYVTDPARANTLQLTNATGFNRHSYCAFFLRFYTCYFQKSPFF